MSVLKKLTLKQQVAKLNRENVVLKVALGLVVAFVLITALSV